MNNKEFISSQHVGLFHFAIHDLIKSRNFICVPAVSRAFLATKYAAKFVSFTAETVGPAGLLVSIIVVLDCTSGVD